MYARTRLTLSITPQITDSLSLFPKRDAEHRESLSTTLRTLRADSLRQTDTLQRLQDKLTEAQRKVALADAEENALRAQLKTAETTIHKLKDEAARTKKFVAETRAACANEVRKRDRQIEGLKKAASDAGRARGERRSAAMTTIHITGEVGGDEPAASTSTMAEDYDLHQETNAFLAQLAKGLSEENETLLSLIRKTNHSLKQMSGWDKAEGGTSTNKDGNAVVMVTNPEDLATDIDSVLDHLRTMLTNPSFVPLEEVVVREEEIFRLRHGWEKMEERWREAVRLIDGWRQRMAANGQPVDMEDLKMGLRLSPVRVQNVEETAHNDVFKLPTLHEEEEEEEEGEEEEHRGDGQNSFEHHPGSPSPPESLHLVPAPGYEDMVPEYEEPQDDLDASDAESSIFQDDVDIDMEELQESEPNVEILQYSTTNHVEASDVSDISESVPLPQPPRITPLEETSSAGNRNPTGSASRKRSGDYIDQNNDDSKPPPPPPHKVEPEQYPQKRLKVSTDEQSEEPKTRPNSDIFTESNSSLDSILLLKPSPESSVSTAPSRATDRSTRSEVTSKKEATPSTAKPATRRTRAVAQEKKETPSKPLPRQRQTRATAATTSSSARSAPSQPGTATKPRAAASALNATTDMPPPPRPTRSANNSPAVQSTPAAASKNRRSSADKNHPPIDTEVTTAPETASKTRAKRVAESPVRSPGKSGSRLPKLRNVGTLPPSQQSPLSMARIAAKLAASEREADAARVRAKLKAARSGKTSLSTTAVNNNTSSLAPSQASSTSKSSSRVVSSGDPTKRDRQASASSEVTGMSGSGTSLSLDENGQTGGVSISRADPSHLADAPHPKQKAEESNDDNNKTVAPSSPRRRNRVKEEEEAVPVPSSAAAVIISPSKGSPTKKNTAAGETTTATKDTIKLRNKREPRSRAEKVASRRRSTLSPWELQSLISGEVIPPSPRIPNEYFRAEE